MKYIFIHFGPKGKRVYVDGFLSFIDGTDEEILKDIETQLITRLDDLKTKDSNTYRSDIVNTTELLYSIQHPDEVNKRGEELVRIKDFNHTSIKVGSWLEDIKNGEHLVNQ